MANSLIGIDIRGLDEVQKLLRDLPPEAQDAAGDVAAVYLTEKLKEQPPPKQVSRKAAYGVTFFSDKQRRWFFAALNSGEISIPYKRTQDLRNSWQIIGKGADRIIVSEAEAAKWTMGDDTQSRHEAMVGWKKVATILEQSSGQLVKRMEGAVNKVIRRLSR